MLRVVRGDRNCFCPNKGAGTGIQSLARGLGPPFIPQTRRRHAGVGERREPRPPQVRLASQDPVQGQVLSTKRGKSAHPDHTRASCPPTIIMYDAKTASRQSLLLPSLSRLPHLARDPTCRLKYLDLFLTGLNSIYMLCRIVCGELTYWSSDRCLLEKRR